MNMRILKSWLHILIKKTLLNKAFIALLLIIPVISVCLGKFSAMSEEEPTATIYISARSSDEVSDAVIEDLIGEYDGYSFVYEEDEDKILHDVRNHTALCGYILEKNQTERIADGKLKGNIILVERIGNLQTDVVNEVVFSAYYKEYTKYYTPIYLGLGDTDTFNKNFDRLTSSTLLNYTIEKLSTDDEADNALERSAHNLVGIIMFLFAMLNISDFILEKEHNLLYPINPKNRLAFRCIYFAVPLMMLSPFALIGTMLQNVNDGFLFELLHILLYDLLLVIICLVLSVVIKKRHIIIGMLPILTIIYIVICPVFEDLSTYLPIIGILRYLCPPFYYML